MRKFPNSKLQRRNFKASLLVCLPIILIIGLAIPIFPIYDGMAQYMIDCGPPSPEALDSADFNQLADMAYEYDYLMETYHIPMNMTATISWNENFSQVISYGADENDALIWTGTALAAQCFRYETARRENNQTDLILARGFIQKLLSGLSMCLVVPNGGLGPEYSGIVARYWGSPDQKDLTPGLFSFAEDPTEESFFNGTGAYSDYRYSAHTSNDQHAGLYLGLAALVHFVSPYELDLAETASLMIDQLCNFKIQNNFLVMDGDGGPDGADQRRSRILGSLFGLTLLKLGASVFPEKYAQQYAHLLLNDLYIETLSNSGVSEALSSYYALNFDHDCWLSLFLLEADPERRNQLFSVFETSIRSTVQYHRNNWFDLIYLVGKSPDAVLDLPVVASIEDQFSRFEINHFPDRRFALVELPIGDQPGEYQFVTGPRLYNDFLYNPFGALYRMIFEGNVDLGEDELYVNKPLTVEYRNNDMFMWQRSPFEYKYPSGASPQSENLGLSFSAPYWLARAFGYFTPEVE